MTCKKCGRPLSDGFLYCPFCGSKLTQEPRKARTRGNGQGTVYKRGDRYIATVILGYYMEGDKLKRLTRSKVCKKKSDAVAALATLRNAPEKVTGLPLISLWNVYSVSPQYAKLSVSQQTKLAAAWERWKPYHARSISSLTVADIEDGLRSGGAYYAAHDMKIVLSHLYDLAVKREIVPINKTVRAQIPFEAPRAKRNCWTRDEVAEFWKAWNEERDRTAGYALVMCYTGLRFGELRSMKLENIHIIERFMIGGEKTDAGREREIPLAEKILPVISSLMMRCVHTLYDRDKTTFYDEWGSFMDRHPNIRRLPAQTCRHYYFTALTTAGVHAGIITETGGHASYLTTMKNYVRIPLEDKLAAVDQI